MGAPAIKLSRKLTAVAAASAAALALSAAPAQAQSAAPDFDPLGSIESASVNPVQTAQASLVFPLVGSFFLGCGLSEAVGGADNGGCTF